MEIKFDKKHLEELYFNGKTSEKRHRFQPQIIAKYRKTIDLQVVTLCNIIELSNHYK